MEPTLFKPNAMIAYIHELLEDLETARTERDRYWQALADIAGLENWQNKAAGDIAREALGDRDAI